MGLHRPAADGVGSYLQRAGRAEKTTARCQVGTGCSGSAAMDNGKPVKDLNFNTLPTALYVMQGIAEALKGGEG